MTRHQFTHTYADGDKITVTLAFNDDQVAMFIDPPVIAPHHEQEYLIWREQVLAPEMIAILPPEHQVALVAYGLKILRDMQEGEEKP